MILSGFYEERAALEKDAQLRGESDCVDFSFLENVEVIDGVGSACMIPLYGIPLTLLDFLHGFCHIFALRLHNDFGYEVRNIFANSGRLIHAYCVNDAGEYIDVRGKTSDLKVFFGEFEDELDIECLHEYSSNSRPATLKDDYDKSLYDSAGYVLSDYPEYYA